MEEAEIVFYSETNVTERRFKRYRTFGCDTPIFHNPLIKKLSLKLGFDRSRIDIFHI